MPVVCVSNSALARPQTPAPRSVSVASDGSLAVHVLSEAPARSIGLLQRKPCYLSPPAQVVIALLRQQVGDARGLSVPLDSRDNRPSLK